MHTRIKTTRNRYLKYLANCIKLSLLPLPISQQRRSLRQQGYRDLLNKGYYETDAEKRKKLILDAEKILMEEMPLAPLHFRGNAYVKNDKVKDFVIFPLGGAYFKYTYIEK